MRSGKIILAAGLFMALAAGPAVGQELSADELVAKMDALLRGSSSYCKMSMSISNPDWGKPRSFELFAYAEEKDQKSFIRITGPAGDRGTGFLKIGYNLWMYVPATEKVLKIPPSMMHDSWMGSDFTNDDLVRESSVVKDYDHRTVSADPSPEGGLVYQLELKPKPNAPVVWGKILVWIWDRGFIPIKEQYFDEQGRMISEMIFSEVKEMGGRTIPTVWEMHSMTKPGHKTELRLSEMKFDLKIDPGIFTEKNLKSKNY